MTLVYVGTYTRDGQSQGIYVYRLDIATGALSYVSNTTGVTNPTYLTLAPAGHTLYAVEEVDPDGGVSAYRVHPARGDLELLNTVPSHGADPAYLSVDPTGQWLLVANYTGGTIAVFPIQSNGALGEAADVVRHSGSGPRADRQAGPHPHMIVTDPTGAFILVPDLGVDRVVAYRLERTSGKLLLQPDGGGQLPAAAGPRHLAFGGGGRWAYVLNELDSTLAVFDYDAATGRLQQMQVVSTLPNDFDGSSTGAAVVVAPSGRFVYASNRGHDSVAVFRINEANGELAALGHTSTGGRTPRDINIDPTGQFLLAANQNSSSIVTLRIDPESGALAPTGHSVPVPSPARVLFA